jgi:hypothetical protein
VAKWLAACTLVLEIAHLVVVVEAAVLVVVVVIKEPKSG